MYRKILVALDTTNSDQELIPPIIQLLHGSTIEAVRHRARIPLLVVPAKK